MLMDSVAVAELKKCWCRPAARLYVCADKPENGVGLLVIQLHPSPPDAPETAPVGRASSTQEIFPAMATQQKPKLRTPATKVFHNDAGETNADERNNLVEVINLMFDSEFS